MREDYSRFNSLSQDEFTDRMKNFSKDRATKSDKEDIRKIERILSLREGILANQEYYVAKYPGGGPATCQCGKTLSFYDVVATSLIEGHSKSFVVHTLCGNKRFVDHPKPITCTQCGTIHMMAYTDTVYGCCNGP